ncbi:hypothetical protein HF072_09880 [Bacillus sp. RO3]|nr:hypothetical protein [Bacillus sp. RO3]
MITLAFAFSFNGVLAEGNNFEELQKKYPNAIEKLEENTESQKFKRSIQMRFKC